MNGILCIDKPAGFTSFDVIAKVRGITGFRKIGHTGTLDPMATGVLPLLFGKATKACDLLPDETKEYAAGFRFGVRTDTQDITGEIVAQDSKKVCRAALLDTLRCFQGTIEQVPPMYSAVRVSGKHLYELARKGQEIERKPRKVTVYRLSLESYREDDREGLLLIRCSKGTYVRTLIDDIGRKLGTGGAMTSLRRIISSGFSLEQCLTLEEVEKAARSGELEKHLLPVESVFKENPSVFLTSEQQRLFLNGARLDLNRVAYDKEDGLHAVYGEKGLFLGVAYPDEERRELRLVSFF